MPPLARLRNGLPSWVSPRRDHALQALQALLLSGAPKICTEMAGRTRATGASRSAQDVDPRCDHGVSARARSESWNCSLPPGSLFAASWKTGERGSPLVLNLGDEKNNARPPACRRGSAAPLQSAAGGDCVCASARWQPTV
ncbi:hypothetical protein HPB50_003738 [Hyalomma asiaticum]|uniref:Uncharacterized protein n=1 Tax=Hyalomma asiaticum TaxID=266040 RepID=A0ACB7SUV0_HYAAI|nr:hypothetical protein HPB50_003738 [Hyalomma asiaticum]